MAQDEDIPPEDFPPGYDDDPSYKGEDIASYPDWWEANIREFQEHGLRPYRPPKFEDGEIVTEIIKELESDLQCDIFLRNLDPHGTNKWEYGVDDTPIGVVSRRRKAEGYSLFEITSVAFKSEIQNAIDERPTE